MPRIAIGDLTLDVDVPARFSCEYTLTGSLIAQASNGAEVFELSVIRIDGSAIEYVTQSAAKAGAGAGAGAGAALHETRADFASFFEGSTWLAGFQNQVLVATQMKGSPPELAAMLSSVAPAHDAFPPGTKLQLSDLRPSHTRFFEQRRTALLDNEGWSPQRHDAVARLEVFWNELLDSPPEDEHLLQTMLSAVGIAFGDLLCLRGFTWAMGRDEWGTTLGVVALRGTADLWVVPEDFIAKRWERSERDFIANAITQISAQVAKLLS